MFGIEKFDERIQVIAILGGIVVVLSIVLTIFFLASLILFKQEELNYDINPPTSTTVYAYGVVVVTFKEGVNATDATALISNLGLTVLANYHDAYDRLVFELKVEKGKEPFWLKRLKRESSVAETSLRKVR